MKQSTCSAIRSCSALSHLYLPITDELFNVAFLSCWTELNENDQGIIINNLQLALNSETIPINILQILLNLSEFMEHVLHPLPISSFLLSKIAVKCNSYAKALHYKELEFKNKNKKFLPEIIGSLISINNKLQQQESAVGILNFAPKKQFSITLRESWFEELNRWEDAIYVYEKNLKLTKPNTKKYYELIVGKMRCLNSISDWKKLYDLSEQVWDQIDLKWKKIIAPLSAKASSSLNKWAPLNKYLSVMNKKNYDYSFFNSILKIQQGKFIQAQNSINNARKIVSINLTGLINESYSRAYREIVKAQQLVELEEIIEFKKLDTKKKKRQKILINCWNKRLLGCQPHMNVWEDILSIHALVIPPKENVDIWLKFASIVRKNGNTKLSKKNFKRIIAHFFK
eukprot:Anaeramoba_flamelloidesc42493_g4_i1.p1 GENE.c42493_g4_i1~~c42493_g4_i1.p1  ORF type:complete len:427 (-),score=104.54 c42493_g4_i1:10-1206(-)